MGNQRAPYLYYLTQNGFVRLGPNNFGALCPMCPIYKLPPMSGDWRAGTEIFQRVLNVPLFLLSPPKRNLAASAQKYFNVCLLCPLILLTIPKSESIGTATF